MPFVAERNLWPFFPQIKNTLQTLSSARCQFQFTHIHTHTYTLTQTPKDTRSYYLWPIAVHISWHVLGNFFPRMLCSKLPPIKFISLKSFHLIFIDSVAPQTHTQIQPHMSALKHTYGTRLSHRLHYVLLLRMFVAYLSFYYVYVTNHKMPCCKFLTQLVSVFPLGSKIENISSSTHPPPRSKSSTGATFPTDFG